MVILETSGLRIEVDESSGWIKVCPKREPHLKIAIHDTVPGGMTIHADDLSLELEVQKFLAPLDSPAEGAPIHNDCCQVKKRRTLERRLPLSSGTLPPKSYFPQTQTM